MARPHSPPRVLALSSPTHPRLDFALLALSPFALVALAALPRGVGLPTLYASLVAGGFLSLWCWRRWPRAEGVEAPSFERHAGWSALLFALPLLFMPVAPGADMAMHVALARSIVDGNSQLSPAWPEVSVAVYPRGLSAWTALLAPVLGLAKAGVATACASHVVFFAALSSYLDRVLRLRFPMTSATVAVLLAQAPQAFFGWGGNTTVLALGLGLAAATLLAGFADGDEPAASRLAVSAVLLLGALAVHPTGALASVLAVVAAPLLRFPDRSSTRWSLRRALAATGGLLLAFGLLALALKLGGPEVSPRERQWILDYQGNVERVVRGPAWLFWLRVWDALPRVLGTTYTGLVLAATLLLLRERQGRRKVAVAAAAVLAWAGAVGVGRVLPGIDVLFYQLRFAPLLLLPTAAVIGFALERVPATRGRMRTAALLVIAALAVFTHVRAFQMQKPIATRNDVRAIGCVAKKLAPGTVLMGAYGDATQWVPALAGLPVKLAHPHCTLLDEIEATLGKAEAGYRFVGERVVYPPRLEGPLPSTTPTCQAGRSALYPLKETTTKR